MQVPQGDTYHLIFTTRAFATGIPGTLSASTVAVYEEATATPIQTAVAVTEDYNSITGLNHVPIVATSGNGYDVGSYYSVVIEAGTVDSVSVVGEVIGHFRCMAAEGVAGVPDVNTTHVGDTVQTALDINDILTDTAAMQPLVAKIPLSDGSISWNATALGAINAECDTALTDYDPPTNTEMVAAFTEIKGATWASGTDTLEHIRDKQTDIETDTAEIGAAGIGLTNLGGSGNDWNTVVPDAAGTAPTAAEIETEVWDALQSAHVIADSMGAIATELATVDDIVDNILLDTAEIGTAGLGLTDLGGSSNNWNVGKTGYSVLSTGLDLVLEDSTFLLALENQVWDAALTGASHNEATSAGKRLRQIDQAFFVTEGTADAATANTIDLETGIASTVDDIYNGDRVLIVAGTGAGEHGLILDYVGSTQQATMSKNWVVTPSTDSEYILVPADCDVELWNDTSVTGDGDWADLIAKINKVPLSDGSISWNSTALADINAEVDTALADIHLDHLMAAAAADVVVDGSVIAHMVSTTEDWSTFVPSTDSLQSIADAGATDPWGVALPGAYGAGTAGEILGDWKDGGRLDLILDARMPTTHINATGGAVDNVTLVATTTVATDAEADIAALNNIAAGDVWAVDATTQQTQGTFGQAIGDPAADTTTIYQAVATDAAGDNVSIDVIAVKAETALIVADTNELQSDDIPTLIAAIQTVVDKIPLSDGSISWNATALAAINAEVDTALDTAISELGVAAPTATPTMRTGLMLLYMALRNKTVVQTSGTDALEIYNDAGTKITSKLLTDNGSDYTEAEMT